MKVNNLVSKMILKKSNKFLKVSLALFAFSLILISIFLTLFLNQYLQISKDFINNNNTHMIEISAFENNDQVRELNFSDANSIKDKIEKENPSSRFVVMNEYQFNVGLEDDKSNVYFLYGLDDSAAEFLHLEQLKDDILYSNHMPQGSTTLSIPVVQLQQEGMSSNKSITKVFSNKRIDKKTPFSLYESNSDQIFISFNTYKNLIEKMYETKWDEFVKQYNKENIYGIQAIYKIFVYVNDISDVENVAKAVNSAGYAINYTFKSFDNFDDSIKNTILISAILLFLVFIITSLNIIFSFNSYIKVQQKDIGILKHYGYSNTALNSIYSRNINWIFLSMALFIVIFIFIFGWVFLGLLHLGYILLVMLTVLIPLFMINRVIYLFMVKKYTNMNVIDLVKTNKEFE